MAGRAYVAPEGETGAGRSKAQLDRWPTSCPLARSSRWGAQRSALGRPSCRLGRGVCAARAALAGVLALLRLAKRSSGTLHSHGGAWCISAARAARAHSFSLGLLLRAADGGPWRASRRQRPARTHCLLSARWAQDVLAAFAFAFALAANRITLRQLAELQSAQRPPTPTRWLAWGRPKCRRHFSRALGAPSRPNCCAE